MKEEFLIDLLKEAVSPFQCVEAAVRRLEEAGFVELPYTERWNLKPGGKYMLNHHGTTLFAFSVGSSYQVGGMRRISHL